MAPIPTPTDSSPAAAMPMGPFPSPPVEFIRLPPKAEVLGHLIINVVVAAIALVAVIVRAYLKRRTGLGSWFVDDFLLFIAVVSFPGLC